MRPSTAMLPKQFKFWPQDAGPLHPTKVIEMYNNGFAGAWHDPAASERFKARVESLGGTVDGHAVMHASGMADTGAGRLVIPFVFVQELFPGALPGAAQQVGDCVSHDTKNACLITLACDIKSGKPDEVTGQVEGVPEIDPEGIKQGALSSEFIYWWRGYNGDGWACEDAADIVMSKAAIMPRNNYPDLGIDLRTYSGSNAHKYGKTPPPDKILQAGKEHLIRNATKIDGFEAIRDMLANGYGVSSCGGEGWSDTRDENGFSKRKGSWSHAIAIIGADDRDEIKQKYGEPLLLFQNSWAVWNSGGRRILNTQVDIPEGSYWAKWSDAKNRVYLAFAGAAGFAAKTLPPFELVVG
jgi:hypothetical protein